MHDHAGGISLVELIGFGLLLAIAVYAIAAFRGGNSSPWPAHRTALWISGCLVAALSVQLATQRHDDFAAHSLAYVGIGLLAPLLLMRAAPATLALRSLSPVPARRLARLFRSLPARFLGHPVTAGILVLGSSWTLYVGGLYGSIHTNGILFVAAHLHIFVAGCLFSAAIAGVDSGPHRARFLTRGVVLFVVMASFSILALYLFGHPPAGVREAQAEAGSLIMYYGGGVVSVALAVLVGTAWYREVARQRARGARPDETQALPSTTTAGP